MRGTIWNKYHYVRINMYVKMCQERGMKQKPRFLRGYNSSYVIRVVI